MFCVRCGSLKSPAKMCRCAILWWGLTRFKQTGGIRSAFYAMTRAEFASRAMRMGVRYNFMLGAPVHKDRFLRLGQKEMTNMASHLRLTVRTIPSTT